MAGRIYAKYKLQQSLNNLWFGEIDRREFPYPVQDWPNCRAGRVGNGCADEPTRDER